MAVDVLFEVWHATVTNLDCLAVKILCNTCSTVNSVSSSLRKVRPMLVETFLLNGGLYQIVPRRYGEGYDLLLTRSLGKQSIL